MSKYNYYTLNECKNLNLIPLSIVQIRRRIKQTLNNPNDKRAIYRKINGTVKILLEKEYTTTIHRKRKKFNKKDTSYCLIKTEISITFKTEFDTQSLATLVSLYNSKLPIIYTIEGMQMKKHLHLGVCEDIDNAKELIIEMCNSYYIPLTDTNIKISQIIDIHKYSNYINKYCATSFLNFTRNDFDINYQTSCNHYLRKKINKQSYLSPYNKSTFTKNVFKHKLNSCK